MIHILSLRQLYPTENWCATHFFYTARGAQRVLIIKIWYRYLYSQSLICNVNFWCRAECIAKTCINFILNEINDDISCRFSPPHLYKYTSYEANPDLSCSITIWWLYGVDFISIDTFTKL